MLKGEKERGKTRQEPTGGAAEGGSEGSGTRLCIGPSGRPKVEGDEALRRLRGMRETDFETVYVVGGQGDGSERCHRVLFVDDEPMICMGMLRMAVARNDLEVVAVLSKRLAFSLLAEDGEYFDAVVIDPGLRDGSGYDLALDVRAVSPHTPIIYFSGSDLCPVRAAKARHAVGDGFVPKSLGLLAALEMVEFTIIEQIELRRLRSTVVWQPPIQVRLHKPGWDSRDVKEVQRLTENDADVSIRNKRVKVTTNTLRLLVRLMLTPEIAVPEEEVRVLLEHSEKGKTWTNIVAQTGTRLRDQLDAALAGARNYIQANRGAGLVFTHRSAAGSDRAK